MTLWVVWFKDHIHTDINGRLAVFCSRDAAKRWVRRHGIPGCKVGRICAETDPETPKSGRSGRI